MARLSERIHVSRKIGAIAESATLAVNARAKALKATGEEVIGFGAGQPDFPTPEPIVAAAVAACSDPAMHHYHYAGRRPPRAPRPLPRKRSRLRLRVRGRAGPRHRRRQAGRVPRVPGAARPRRRGAPARAVLDDVSRVDRARRRHARGAADDRSHGFRVAIEQLEAARTERTKALLFVSPSNPTGAVYPRGEVEAIGRWALEHGIWVVTDEIYEHLTFGDHEFTSMPAVVPELADACVVVNGVAKTYAMTGWRVGLIAPLDVVSAAGNLQSHFTSNVANVSQRAALAAVSGDLAAVAEIRVAFQRRRPHHALDAHGHPGRHLHGARRCVLLLPVVPRCARTRPHGPCPHDDARARGAGARRGERSRSSLARRSAHTMSGAQPSPTVAPLTSAGTILGTLHYMSPEQVEGKDADHRSDIFALGCVIYEMVTGTRAFNGETPASTMAAILERQPPPASTQSGVAPAWIDWIIQTALAKDPDDRWQSAGDLARVLGELPRVTEAPVPSRTWSARPFVLVAAILASIALAAMSLFLWMQRATPAAPPQLARLAVSTVPATEVANTQGGSVAISPDGNVIAFVGARDGVRALYIRHLDQPEALELANTARRNGTSVFARRPMAGVHPRPGLVRLAPGESVGGDRSHDDHPVAIRGAARHRLDAWRRHHLRQRGKARSVASTAMAARRFRWPLSRPVKRRTGGRHSCPTMSTSCLLRVRPHSRGGMSAPLYVQNVRTGERRALDLQGTSPRFIPPNRLIFNRDNRLFLVAFDPQSLTVLVRRRRCSKT